MGIVLAKQLLLTILAFFITLEISNVNTLCDLAVKSPCLVIDRWKLYFSGDLEYRIDISEKFISISSPMMFTGYTCTSIIRTHLQHILQLMDLTTILVKTRHFCETRSSPTTHVSSSPNTALEEQQGLEMSKKRWHTLTWKCPIVFEESP